MAKRLSPICSKPLLLAKRAIRNCPRSRELPLVNTPWIRPLSVMMKLDRVPGGKPSCRLTFSSLGASGANPVTDANCRSKTSGEAEATSLRSMTTCSLLTEIRLPSPSNTSTPVPTLVLKPVVG